MHDTCEGVRGSGPGADDEIEIVEIVGLEDDAADALPADEPAASPRGWAVEPAGIAPADVPGERERYLRLLADFENYKRQAERQRERESQQATAVLVGRLLAVLDNLERALAVDAGPDHEESLRDGIVLIFRQVLDELRKEGLEPIEAIGQPFDPHHHEALDVEPLPGAGPNVVIDELQRGYLFRGRLLRPARVKVGVTAPTAGG